MSTIPFPLEVHTKACLFGALKSALENFRDQEDLSNKDWRFRVSNDLLAEADGYLRDDMQPCICRVGAFTAIRNRFEKCLEEGATTVREEIEEWTGHMTDFNWAGHQALELLNSELANNTISVEDYAQIAGMINRSVWPFVANGVTDL